MAANLSLEQALARLTRAFAPLGAVERVALTDARGRVLAADLIAAFDIPAFDNSAMDGYALRVADLAAGTPLREIGRALAGHAFGGSLVAGTCVRIMTGAPLPSDADTVVMLEDVRVAGDSVAIESAPMPGANIRRRGEHIAAGDIVLQTGRRLSAACLGLATLIGATHVLARRRLRVGVLSTGDELADPPAPLPASGCYDANRPLLRAALQSIDSDVHDLGICTDDQAVFSRCVDAALGLKLDVLLVSGGAAQGDADIVRQAGGIEFLPLSIRPGRGVALGRIVRDGHVLALLGLPGNAVAAFVMFHLLARPLLDHLAGGVAAIPQHVPLPLAVDLQLRGGHVDYRRGRFVRDGDGKVAVQPLREQGSAMLRTVTDADVLLAVGPQASYRAGDLVGTVLLAALD